MVTVCTVDLSVMDAAHCLGCVDRLSGGHSTAVIDSGTNRHNGEVGDVKTEIEQHYRKIKLVVLETWQQLSALEGHMVAGSDR